MTLAERYQRSYVDAAVVLSEGGGLSFILGFRDIIMRVCVYVCALALVRCSIEADQGGTPHARARVSLVSWEGRSHALLFMVPLGLPSARPMAQALRLPFEY